MLSKKRVTSKQQCNNARGHHPMCSLHSPRAPFTLHVCTQRRFRLFKRARNFGPIVSKTQEDLDTYNGLLSGILDQQQQVKKNGVPVMDGSIRLSAVADEIQVFSGSITTLGGAAGVDVNGIEAQLAAHGARAATLGVRITKVKHLFVNDPYKVFNKWRPSDDTRATVGRPYKVYVVTGLWYAAEVQLFATCAVNAGVTAAMRDLAALLGGTLQGVVDRKDEFAIKLELNQLQAPIAATLWKLKPDIPSCEPMKAIMVAMGVESGGVEPPPAETEELVDWEQANGQFDVSDDSDDADDAME